MIEQQLSPDPASPDPASPRKSDPVETPAARLNYVWISLVGIGTASLVLLICVWTIAGPASNNLWYEVAKSSLQVLAVVVVGGIVTAVAANLQHARQKQESALQYDRQMAQLDLQENRRQAEVELQDKRQRAEVELQHERQVASDWAARRLQAQQMAFELRANLMDRACRCAQVMYVTCQHVSRVERDNKSTADGGEALRHNAHKLLDDAYLQFSSEAQALTAEFGARFGFRKLEPEPGTSALGLPHLRWHQISDLLTVYYFTLKGNFRADVLQNNSPSVSNLHSGIDFVSMVAELSDMGEADRADNRKPIMPQRDELYTIRKAIRATFTETLERLVLSILHETPHLTRVDDDFVELRPESVKD